MKPFWRMTTQEHESLFFIEPVPGQRPCSRLLFPPEKVLGVSSVAGDVTFRDGDDFVIDPATGVISLPKGSRIPYRTRAELYPAASSAGPRIGHLRDDPQTHLLFGEGAFFHYLQVEIAYTHAPNLWQGYVPAFAGAQLPRTLRKLRARETLTIGLSGDSISEGANASGCVHASPALPPYSTQFANALQENYGAPIRFKNFAVGGWDAGAGLRDVPRIAAEKPDLAIIAYGMNDVGGRNPDGYQKNIEGMLAQIRAASPQVEFILVATMLGNFEWVYLAPEMFPVYRDRLQSLCGPGVVLADLTAMWGDLLRRKSLFDLTGNGVNHPNDFGHRIYAQVLSALLIEA